MCMLGDIRAKRDEIYAIARRHKAKKLWGFGSCVRREERPDSDVDILAVERVSFRGACVSGGDCDMSGILGGEYRDETSIAQLSR